MMDHGFEIDEHASFLNSGASFDVLQKKYEAVGYSEEKNIATTSSYMNPENTFSRPPTNTSCHPNNHKEYRTNINEVTSSTSHLNTANSQSNVNSNSNKNNEISFIKELFMNDFNKQCVPITNIIIAILREFEPREQLLLVKKLRGHVGVYKGGHPWIDLEACWILNLHKANKASDNIELPNEPPLLNKIKFALAEGRHVPIQHVILGLHLAQFNPDVEDYPYQFTDNIDVDFVKKINRSDVLRAINVHSLFLIASFPQIGMQLNTVLEYLWNFMFKQKHTAIAGMELYNEIFFNFTCHLGLGKIEPLRHIPLHLVEKVTNNYRKSK